MTPARSAPIFSRSDTTAAGRAAAQRFSTRCEPRLALVSVGAGNSYHLPTPTVMRALAAHGAQVLRTDHLGTIVVRTDGHRIFVEAAGETWELSRTFAPSSRRRPLIGEPTTLPAELVASYPELATRAVASRRPARARRRVVSRSAIGVGDHTVADDLAGARRAAVGRIALARAATRPPV